MKLKIGDYFMTNHASFYGKVIAKDNYGYYLSFVPETCHYITCNRMFKFIDKTSKCPRINVGCFFHKYCTKVSKLEAILNNPKLI